MHDQKKKKKAYRVDTPCMGVNQEHSQHADPAVSSVGRDRFNVGNVGHLLLRYLGQSRLGVLPSRHSGDSKLQRFRHVLHGITLFRMSRGTRLLTAQVLVRDVAICCVDIEAWVHLISN